MKLPSTTEWVLTFFFLILRSNPGFEREQQHLTGSLPSDERNHLYDMLTPFTFNLSLAYLLFVKASNFPTPSAFVSPVLLHHRMPDFKNQHEEQYACPRTTDATPLTALDFYSGIGGLRLSLEMAMNMTYADHASGGVAVIRSFEISTVANAVYEHNFRGSRVTRRSIEHLSAVDVDGVADIWLLSPPCQPFCKVGKQMDVEDPRCLSFLHLLSLLQQAATPPSHFFLENVREFEGSRAHDRLLEVLRMRGYHVTQYLLSPVQLGIPNTRLRYYCLASRQDVSVQPNPDLTAVKQSPPPDLSAKRAHVTGWAEEGRREIVHLHPLSKYLDPTIQGTAALPLLMSPKLAVHANKSLRFDVVTSRSTETTTFTKGYGKHAGKAGPMILLTEDSTRRVSDEDLGRFPEVDLGPAGRELRWFSDCEMLRLHGFPEWFSFPPDLTLRQRFGLVGNSVNVEVVRILLSRLLFHDGVQSAGDEWSNSDILPAVEA